MSLESKRRVAHPSERSAAQAGGYVEKIAGGWQELLHGRRRKSSACHAVSIPANILVVQGRWRDLHLQAVAAV